MKRIGQRNFHERLGDSSMALTLDVLGRELQNTNPTREGLLIKSAFDF